MYDVKYIVKHVLMFQPGTPELTQSQAYRERCGNDRQAIRLIVCLSTIENLFWAEVFKE